MRKAHAAFYFSINFGLFLVPCHPVDCRQTADLGADANFFDRILWQMKQAGFGGYSWAFGVPGILMALAIDFLAGHKTLRPPPARQ